MKHLTLITCFFAAFGCNSPKQATSLPANVLNGSWTPVKQEIAGKALPPAAFKDQHLIISDSLYTFTAESVDKGVVRRYSPGKMDIYGREGVNRGKHFTAIYKVDNNLLTICYNLEGDTYPADFETSAKPMLFLCVFKKDGAK